MKWMEIGIPYSAAIIRKVTTKFGQAFVVESSAFQFFLPKAYSGCEIRQYDLHRIFIVREDSGVRKINFFRTVDTTPDMME